MADYIYLLENRLSAPQRNALRIVRELARSRNLTVFLVGGAVRDLTSGSPVRDLDVVVQGNALKLKKDLEKTGAVVSGEIEAGQALFLTFPGSVRMEFGSTLSVTFPKPGKPVLKPASILDDLRRRDFTANAMALSLNEGSYGLLMDPLNGVADIENRELRLVSNYGFIEDPVRMIRAARLMARLGWTLDEKTQSRYDTGKEEGYISALSALHRGYETEEIVFEEDPLRVLRRLEEEGWMKALAPFWTSAKADAASLEQLREAQTQLQMQGIHPEAAAANFPLLTAKLSAKEIDTLKTGFVRQGFVKEIESLETRSKDLSALLLGKSSALPSQAWKVLTSAPADAVLWLLYSSRSAALQAKLKSFLTVWPQARQKMPYTMMQEMRIVPELPGYEDLLEKLFFELMDDKLQTPEEMKAFLEPFSPPAPPPPVNLRRPRAAKKETKAKSRVKKAAPEAGSGAESSSDLDAVVIEALDELAAEDLTGRDSAGENATSAARAEAVNEPTPASGTAARSLVKASAKAGSKPAGKAAATAPPPARTPPAAARPSAVATSVPAKKAASAPAGKSAPAKGAPAKQVPPKAVPAKAAAAKAAPAKETLRKTVPAKAVPAKKAPAKAAPAKAAPSKAAASKKSSAAGPSRVTAAKSSGKTAVKAAAKTAPKPPTPARKAAAKRVPKKAAKSAPPPAKAPAKKTPAKSFGVRAAGAKTAVARKSSATSSPAKKAAPAPTSAKKTPNVRSASKNSAPAKKRG